MFYTPQYQYNIPPLECWSGQSGQVRKLREHGRRAKNGLQGTLCRTPSSPSRDRPHPKETPANEYDSLPEFQHVSMWTLSQSWVQLKDGKWSRRAKSESRKKISQPPGPLLWSLVRILSIMHFYPIPTRIYFQQGDLWVGIGTQPH